jgi:hypothetical protein
MKKYILVIFSILMVACADSPPKQGSTADDVGLCLYQIKSSLHSCLLTTRDLCASSLEYLEITYISQGGLEYGDFIKTDNTCADIGCNYELAPGVYECEERTAWR